MPFVSIDLLPGEQYVGFEADIGNRTVKCLLDTGCTLNLMSTTSSAIDEEFVFGNIDFANPRPSTILSVNGHQLGSCVFHETQLPFGTEAIVGVSFLKTQIVCIDFVNNKLYLFPIPEEDSSVAQE